MAAGGFTEVNQALDAIGTPAENSLTGVYAGMLGIGFIIGNISIGFGYPGQPFVGMAVTYSAFGTLTALAGNQMQALFTMPGFIVFMAILFIVLGLSMLGLFNMQMPSSLMNQANNIMDNQKGGSYAGVFVIGILSAFLVTIVSDLGPIKI